MLTEDGIKDGCEASQKLRIYYICVKHQKSEVDFTQKRQKKKRKTINLKLAKPILR